VRALLLELGCGGGQRQRPGPVFRRKTKTQDEKNKGRQKGDQLKRQRPNENAIGQKQLPTYLFFLPSYLHTYLPTYRKEKKRNCTRNGYNNRVPRSPFFSLSPFFQC
jgi:hypothetical protein